LTISLRVIGGGLFVIDHKFGNENLDGFIDEMTTLVID
jgi:hypothetical protein